MQALLLRSMSGSFVRCAHVRVGVVLHRQPWLGPSLLNALASKAIRHYHHTQVKLSASQASRIHGDAVVSKSKLRSDTTRDAKISVHNASRKDVDEKLCTRDAQALTGSHHEDKGHSVDDDAQVSGFAAHMPHAKALCHNADVRVAETDALSCQTQSLHVSLQTLSKQRPNKAPNEFSVQLELMVQKQQADLQQKIGLLELDQLSPSDATKLLKARAFKLSSVEQLAAVLQELKRCFSCDRLVRDIVVKSSIVLLEPAEFLQKKLQLLRDFQVEEKVITKLCAKAGVLSLSTELLQKKLMYFDNIGLTVEARNMMFWRAPGILRWGIETCIEPALKFLESEGFAKENVLKTAQRCPHIFCMSLDSLMRKYEYIKQFGFSSDKFPTVLLDRGSVISNIEKHLHTLRELGFTDDDLQVMIKHHPAILVLSSENLKCKVDFLINKQHRTLAEIVHFPSSLLYSLQARVIPRFNILDDLGLSRKHSLIQILRPTDSNFVKMFQKAG